MKSKFVLLILIVLLGAFLRFYQIDNFPHGLYIDEASIGHNAYSILTTGTDEHGEKFPIFFEAFGEYKLPVYIYMTSGSIALFGKDDFAVRFPSALFGSLTVLLLYFLLTKFLKLSKLKKNALHYLPLLSSFLLAISPWHIHFSRGGFEANVALFFFLLGILLAVVYWDTRKVYFIILAALAFVITLYSYNTYRFVVPATWFVFFILCFKNFPKKRKSLLLTTVLFLVLSIPMFMFAVSPSGNARFASESAFVEYATPTTIDKAFAYPMIFVKNYISFFSPEFLFSSGDGNGRHQIHNMGLFYKWQIPFLLIGLFWLFRQKRSVLTYFIIGLLLIAPVIPALVRPSPHTLRALLLVIPLSILIAAGVYVSIINLKKFKKWIVVSVVALAVLFESSLYLHDYYFHYKNINALDWGGGYKETIQKAVAYQKTYPNIVVDKTLHFVQTYFKFYAPELPVTYVTIEWKGPTDSQRGKTLYIRPYYGNREEKLSIDEVYLPGPNKDIFTQFWKL